MAVCRAHGWTLSQFGQLGELDREMALAYELYRRKSIRAWRDSLIKHEHHTPDAATIIYLAGL